MLRHREGERLFAHRISLAAVTAVCSIVLIASLVGCAVKSDPVVTSKIKAKLAADPQVNPFEIDVDTDDGVVRLSGNVEQPGDRDEAERLARNTKGVKEVVNEIEIGDLRTGEVISDQWIESKVKSKLAADPDVNPFRIDVDVVRGVVTLSGRVDDEHSREAAETLARDTKGVAEVSNRIRVEPSES